MLAVNLRPTVASLPPIFDEMGREFGLDSPEVTAIAAIPVLCFGVFAFVSSSIAQRMGDERTIGLATACLVTGLAIRPFFGTVALFAGTVLATSAIATMNVLVASLVRRRHPAHVGVILGCYFLLFAVGQSVAPGVSVLLYQASGHQVSVPMVIWAAPAVVGFLIWAPQWRRRARPTDAVRRLPLRSATAWHVTLFMALQSFTFYGASSFLPDIFRDRGVNAVTAGFLASVMGFGGLAVSFATPVVAARIRHTFVLVVIGVSLVIIGATECVFGTLRLEYAWAAALGVGQGILQPLAIYLTIIRAADSRSVAPLSAMAQGFGYLIALLGPVAMGVAHRATGAWRVPGTILVAVAAATLAIGYLASRQRVVGLSVAHNERGA